MTGLDPAGSMDTFGFLGLPGADPMEFAAPGPGAEVDKVDDDEGIAFVTLGEVGMRLVLPWWDSPLEAPGECPRLDSPLPPSPFDDTSAKPLILRFSAVFRSEAN